MACPKCGYAMDAFDKECPRCHGQGLTASNSSPNASTNTTPSAANSPIFGSPGVAPSGSPVGFGPPPPFVPPATFVAVSNTDEPSRFLNASAFLFPIIGFFVWIFLSLRDNVPIKARAVGRHTAFGFLFGLGVWFVLVWVSGAGAPSQPSASTFDNGSDAPTAVVPATTEVNKAELEDRVKREYNDSLKDKGVTSFYCTSVSLVKEASNKYTGFADIYTPEIDNTHKLDVSVTFGDEGDMIWKVG